MNLALYGERGKRWAMTERSQRRLERTPQSLVIGPSSLQWDGSCLHIACDEVTVPWPSRLKGAIRVQPQALPGRQFELDVEGRHCWTPIAPCARVSVELEQPRQAWQGHGYLDSNTGSEPLEDGFRNWSWSRATADDGSTAVYYDTCPRRTSSSDLALKFRPDGTIETLAAAPTWELPRTGWRMPRRVRSEAPQPARPDTLEDTPFYARSLLTTTLGGERLPTVHESLSLDRFRRPVVQWMLPFRMPRRA